MEKNYYPLEFIEYNGKNKTPYLEELIKPNAYAIDLNQFAKQLVEAYNEKYGPKEGSAHSFTEGMDVPKVNPDDAQFQAGQLFRKKEDDEMIKSLIGSARLVDVEKVIEDLCQYVRDTQIHVPPCLSNGEVALGMLQAFKKERVGHIGTRLEKKVADVTGLPPLKDGKLQKILHPLIICVGKPWSTRYKVIEASSMLRDVNDLSECAEVYDKKICTLLEFNLVILSFPNDKGVLWSELVNKADVVIKPDDIPSSDSYRKMDIAGDTPQRNILNRLAKGLDNTSARGEAIAIMNAIDEMLKLRGL